MEGMHPIDRPQPLLHMIDPYPRQQQKERQPKRGKDLAEITLEKKTPSNCPLINRQTLPKTQIRRGHLTYRWLEKKLEYRTFRSIQNRQHPTLHSESVRIDYLSCMLFLKQKILRSLPSYLKNKIEKNQKKTEIDQRILDFIDSYKKENKQNKQKQRNTATRLAKMIRMCTATPDGIESLYKLSPPQTHPEITELLCSN